MANFSFDDGNASSGNSNRTGGLEGSPTNGSGQDSGIGTGINDTKGTNGGIEASAAPVVKKRGRKPFPRDAAGNIIRDASAASSGTNQSRKAGLDLDGFILNDRPKVRQQIQGMHAAAAMLTKQPVFMLHDTEAIALTDALCDVCDYHKMNLTQKGGVYGLYIALAMTMFGIYKPRIDIILSGGQIVGVAPTAATNENEAKQRSQGNGMMNFADDIKEN